MQIDQVLEAAHDFLDDYTKENGFFRDKLGPARRPLSNTPIFVLSLLPLQGRKEIHVVFSLDDALNTVSPGRQVEAVVEQCFAALRKTNADLQSYALKPLFMHGGQPPR